MDARTTPRARRLMALMVVAPLVAACGGGPRGDDGDDGSWAAGAQRVLTRGADLVISTDNGVRLRPADGDRVGVDRHVRHRWSHRNDTWVLGLSCPEQDVHARECPRMPEVDVPAGTTVTVLARDAGIDVAGVPAALHLTTVNGDVTVTGSGRPGAAVRLATRNGSVHAGALRAGRVHAETVNGDVTLDCADAPGGVGAVSANGSVRVTVPRGGPAYRVAATTDNGRPSVDVPTTDEDGAADGDDGRTMTLTTVNGDVTARVG